jgi:hypothetical protein
MNHYTFWEVFMLSCAGALGWNVMDAISSGFIDGILFCATHLFKIEKTGSKPVSESE